LSQISVNHLQGAQKAFLPKIQTARLVWYCKHALLKSPYSNYKGDLFCDEYVLLLFLNCREPLWESFA